MRTCYPQWYSVISFWITIILEVCVDKIVKLSINDFLESFLDKVKKTFLIYCFAYKNI